MTENKKYSMRKILVISVWILLGSGTVVLLISAISKKNNEPVSNVEITISGVQNNYFIDKKDVMKIMERTNGKSIEKAVIGSLDLSAMEASLQKDQWIEKAEIFFDNNNVLQVKIREREPVARIFTSAGSSFYMDSSLTRLPLSEKFSARLPVFTNFPTEVVILNKKDSLLLKDIKTLSMYIGGDPFWMAQIEQVDVTSEGQFELIPKLGNQVIRFGSADEYKEKFNKLMAFYKQVQAKTGWNNYSVLDLKFKSQVVAISRDAKEIKMDSLRAIQIMKNIIAEAQKRSSDSTDVQLIQQEDDNSRINTSSAMEEMPEENLLNNKAVENKTANDKIKASSSVVPVHVPEKPILKNPESTGKPSIKRSSSNEKPGPTPLKKTVEKRLETKKEVIEKKEEKINQVPRAVMPPKSDY